MKVKVKATWEEKQQARAVKQALLEQKREAVAARKEKRKVCPKLIATLFRMLCVSVLCRRHSQTSHNTLTHNITHITHRRRRHKRFADPTYTAGMYA